MDKLGPSSPDIGIHQQTREPGPQANTCGETDKEVVRKSGFLTKVIKEYGPMLRRYLARHLIVREDADDLLQEHTLTDNRFLIR